LIAPLVAAVSVWLLAHQLTTTLTADRWARLRFRPDSGRLRHRHWCAAAGIGWIALMICWPPAGVAIAALLVGWGVRCRWRRQWEGRLAVRQLAWFLLRFAQQVRTGSGMTAAWADSSRNMPEPLGNWLAAVRRQHLAGRALGEAVSVIPAPGDRPEFSHLSRILGMRYKSTSAMVGLLDALRLGLEERLRRAEEMSARTLETRLSCWVLAILPLVTAVLLYCLAPETLLVLATTGAGRAALVFAVVTWSAGVVLVLWLAREAAS